MSAMKRAAVVLSVLAASACASAPPAPPAPVKPVGPSFEQKMGWMLRLEDQRLLRDPGPTLAPPPPPPTANGQAAVAAPATLPPDLVRLLSDEEARVRRRAALAVGHVGLAEGVAPLIEALADTDAEVRQMAAFALGLLGDKRATDPLIKMLEDPAAIVQGSAAEALGLVGDPAAAAPLGSFVGRIVQSTTFAQVPGDDDDVRRDTPSSACRLAIYALVRLKAYGPLASAVLDGSAEPRVKWWPVAFALQRLENPASLPALITLAKDPNPYTRAFAVKGLAALKDRAALPVLMPLLSSGERNVLVETVRALGRIGDPSAAEPLMRLMNDPAADPTVRLEVVGAIGGVRVPAVSDALIDVLADPSPAIRSAALRSLSNFDNESFVILLSGLDPDTHWQVRSTLASLLGGLTADSGLPRLELMLNDSDQRVLPAVFASLVKLNAPNAAAVMFEHLKADDAAVRTAAANGLGELKPPNSAVALTEAYDFGQRDPNYTARAAALAALAKYDPASAIPVLKRAFTDKDWAVRVRAAMLLKQIDPAAAADADTLIRPAPTTVAADLYTSPKLVSPPVSTQVYLDTDRGTIQIELAVNEAPLTTQNFISLALKGYFNGLSVHRVVPDFVMQDGDPRGDGEGGPGYTIRDEFNERPYLRGSVGMALDPWPDTGGSQYFITHSPQPHLDAKYTVFGQVIAGMDVVDKIQQWDVIRQVRVWDGVTMTNR
jgi:HEAT repeat protein